MKAYMAISAKVGCFNRVLDELINMKLSKKDVFLLFGPLDIIVRFKEIESFNGFIKEWYDPIRKILPQNPLIDKTETFIVAIEGKPFNEEPYAFVFANCNPSNIEEVQQEIQKIPNVLSAEVVFGPYDLICPVKATNKAQLQRLVSEIEKISGIQDTVTEIVASLY
jgi:hypothetical protein